MYTVSASYCRAVPSHCNAIRDARWNISVWNILKFHENFEIFQDPFLKYFMKLLIFNIKWLFKNMIKVYQVSRRYIMLFMHNSKYLPLTGLLCCCKLYIIHREIFEIFQKYFISWNISGQKNSRNFTSLHKKPRHKIHQTNERIVILSFNVVIMLCSRSITYYKLVQLKKVKGQDHKVNIS